MMDISELLLEAGSVAANARSAACRLASAREVLRFDVTSLGQCNEGRGHLAVAIRAAVLALATVDGADTRTATAEAIRGLVKAARCEPGERGPGRTVGVRQYWLDGDR